MGLILNTLVFENDVQSGATQLSLVERIAKLHASGIEVRREYFKDIHLESSKIKERTKIEGLLVNYSVPEVIFLKDGTVNPELKNYLQEAQEMGADKIKFNIGNFENFQGNIVNSLKPLLNYGIKINVENDQTTESGSYDNILRFLKEIYSAGLKEIGYVYDLGNWAIVKENAKDAANTLSPYIDYVHLKNMKPEKESYATTDDLNSGIYNWREFLNIFPNNVEYALEYPMHSDELISSQMSLVQQAIQQKESKSE
ncbi:TIM barrel protein [Oenococcus sp. UCMA 14587]|nr:TIM barrel protein [Oenococcus sp. UCMA 14587]